MHLPRVTLLVAAAAVAGNPHEGTALAAPGAPAGVAEAFPNLVFQLPIDLIELPTTPPRMLLAEQRARLLTFAKSANATTTQVVLDLSDRMKPGDWMGGILGVALAPRFPSPPHVYVFYTGTKTLRLSRWRMDPATAVMDRAGEEILLEHDVPNDFHHGGALAFDRAGLLHVAIGDIGPQHDPGGVAQDLGQLRGKILRIDVRKADPGRGYAIPADNPFVGRPGARPEIWAYGLRNVWRMSFDARGRLWAGDVGQNAREEINLIVKGGNYGWNLREGQLRHDVPPDKRTPASESKQPSQPSQRSAATKDPLFDYGHELGRSITAGFVYTGAAWPALRGRYLFADWGSGRILALPGDGRSVTTADEVAQVPQVNSVARDRAGEPYFVSMTGRIYQFSSRPSPIAIVDATTWETSPLLALAVSSPTARSEGRALYAQGCHLCHGGNGEGAMGPNLRDDRWKKGGSLAAIARSIASGSPYVGMPAWSMVYPPDKIAALAVHVAGLQCTADAGGKAPEGDRQPPALDCGKP